MVGCVGSMANRNCVRILSGCFPLRKKIKDTKQFDDLREETVVVIAVWIIAICEIVRALQNMIQLIAIRHDSGQRDNAYAEFIKSIKKDDKQFVKEMLEEFERQYGEHE